jgi:scyllo-inositol 2-dehydrogenase (NADP+)
MKEDINMASGINAAVVGYGYAGRSFHSYLIGLAEGLNLYAISTRDPGRRAAAERERNVKTYPDIDELLKDDNLDLVVIATPHDTHAELAIKSMDAGKHVVVDKAMCMNTAEADAMIEASKGGRHDRGQQKEQRHVEHIPEPPVGWWLPDRQKSH